MKPELTAGTHTTTMAMAIAVIPVAFMMVLLLLFSFYDQDYRDMSGFLGVPFDIR